MNYQIAKLPKSEIEILVTTPFTDFEPQVKRAATLISEEIEIEGFRKGKAPYDIVKSRIGEQAIYERAAELAVRATYPNVLAGIRNQESGIRDFLPVGQPQIVITKLAPGNELQYKVRTAIMPEVKLPDYKKIAKRVFAGEKEVSVSDEEVEKALEWVREAKAPIVTVSREARKGDRVEVDFEARLGGVNPHTISGATEDASEAQRQIGVGVKIEGGESKNHPFIIGKSKFVPGFEKEIIGMKAGEEKTFTLKVPENWHEKNLAGKALDFRTSLRLVQEIQLPELTDEFAQSMGDFKGREDLKNSLRDSIGQEKKDKEKERLRVLTIEEVAGEAVINVPDVLIDGEAEKMLEELKSGVGQMGVRWEDYLAHIKKTIEDLRKEWRGEAEKRVRIALCLREIAKLEKIEPNKEEIEARSNQFLVQFKSAEETGKSVDAEGLREYTRGILQNEKVFELLETS